MFSLFSDIKNASGLNSQEKHFKEAKVLHICEELRQKIIFNFCIIYLSILKNECKCINSIYQHLVLRKYLERNGFKIIFAQ